MKVACVYVEHFIVRAERARSSEPAGKPVIVVENSSSCRVVADASEDASGVIPGMPLSQAISRCPEADIITSEPAYYKEVWSRILDRLEGSSPFVEDGGLGCAYVGIESEENNLVRTLLAAPPSYWRARIGTASAKFPAYIAAVASSPGRWSRAPSDLPTYLASLSVNVLPLSRQMISRLDGFGLYTLGHIANLRVSALQAQFGGQGKLAWELASGIDRRPLVPRRPQIVIREAMSFLAPIATIDALLAGIETLLGKAFGRKELRGRCAKMAVIEAEIYGAPSFTKRVIFKDPVMKERAYFVIRNSLTDLRLPGPVESISLTLSKISGEAGRQTNLFSDVRKRDNLREVLQELQIRFPSLVPLYRVREVEPWSRIPERRHVLVPYFP